MKLQCLLAALAVGLCCAGCTGEHRDVSADRIKQEDEARVRANEEAAKKSGIDMSHGDR